MKKCTTTLKGAKERKVQLIHLLCETLRLCVKPFALGKLICAFYGGLCCIGIARVPHRAAMRIPALNLANRTQLIENTSH